MRCILLLFFLTITADLFCQETAAARVRSLLAKATAQRPEFGDTSPQAGLAIRHAEQAMAIAGKNKMAREFHEAGMLKIEALYATGKVQAMEQMLLSTKDSLKAEVARNISRHYNDGYFCPRDASKSVEYARLSIELSQGAKDLTRRVNGLNQLAYVYLRSGDADKAEEKFTEVVRIASRLRSEHASFPYLHLMLINEWRGYLNKAVQIGLDGIRHLDFTGYTLYKTSIYLHIARMYWMLSDLEKSIEFFRIAQQECFRQKQEVGFWFSTRGMIDHLLTLQRPEEARRLYDEAYQLIPSPKENEAYILQRLASARLNIVFRQYAIVDSCLAQALRVNAGSDYGVAIDRAYAERYFSTKQFDKAKTAIEKSLSQPEAWSVYNIAEVHQFAYRVDSARGDLASALSHLHVSKKLTDSLNVSAKARQAEELTIQYQTEKIKRDIQFKEQTIQLMEKQQALQAAAFGETRLKFVIDSTEKQNRLLSMSATAAERDKELAVNQRNIDQLQSDNASRQSRLENATFTRNIILLVVLLLAIMLLMLYRQFKAKQAANKLIDKKNTRLEELVKQKQSLVEEKDWLLKEIHHRVKNNLQTVISLLESQSHYLDSEALSANQVSRNRVYAMSLVHQKLYQTENVASVQMDVYLRELVDHLRDCMDIKGIQFVLKLIQIQLDVSQAISLGLILNEAITNSIKHAFPNGTNGAIIEVEMDRKEEGELVFLIRDNGIGISADLQKSRPTSLGLKLIKGLTEDLEGRFEMNTKSGTAMTITFVPKDPFSSLNGVLA
ncbi:sensor histidine kinase [Terrimonas sp. NA20]|uniref:histidine kinase n=1 Tax=Terrimonas ginsenosidimutans TaxID=2908004 RepID=A0ABS9KMM0_9BACT|nr:sensor histidine kinase [Terrimonas ginsenosidimutans]MCG2613572.1 sensor histidine kinase [Terrimonas ginsenosidimutans]